MFTQLYSLLDRFSTITPTEDFLTEIVVGCIRGSKTFREIYLTKFLGLRSDAIISLSTQYPIDGNFIDIFIETEDEICFVENKVDSGEGEGQLLKYANILGNQLREKTVKLRFCTRFQYERTAQNFDIDFKHVFWSHLHRLLVDSNQSPANSIIHSFIQLTSNLKLDIDTMITPNTLAFFQSLAGEFSPIFQLMESYHNFISKRLRSGFSRFDHNFAKQYNRFGRFVGYNSGVIGRDSDHVFGIRSTEKKTVTLFMEMWVGVKNPQYGAFVKFAKLFSEPREEKKGYKYMEDEFGAGISKDINMTKYLHLDEKELQKELELDFASLYEEWYLFYSSTKSGGHLNWVSEYYPN